MFRSILLPVDLASEASWRKPLALALQLARQGGEPGGEPGGGQGGATLHAMSVVPDFGMSIVGSYFEAGFEKRVIDETAEKLAAWAAEQVPGDVKVETHVAHGRIYEQLLRAADKLGCDAIVLGAHRPDFSDYLLGPNAARVVRHAKQSVMVVRD